MKSNIWKGFTNEATTVVNENYAELTFGCIRIRIKIHRFMSRG